MSNENKSKFSLNQLFGKRKLLVVLAVILAISLASGVGAYLITSTSLFGPPSGPSTSTTPSPVPTASPTPTATPIPVYSGTVGIATWVNVANPSVHNPAAYPVGATLTLSATLTPAPLVPQTVWFYYSNTPILVDSHGIPTIPDQLVGIDTVVASAGSTSASVSFVVPSSGNTYYYIAEIPVPT